MKKLGFLLALLIGASAQAAMPLPEVNLPSGEDSARLTAELRELDMEVQRLIENGETEAAEALMERGVQLVNGQHRGGGGGGGYRPGPPPGRPPGYRPGPPPGPPPGFRPPGYNPGYRPGPPPGYRPPPPPAYRPPPPPPVYRPGPGWWVPPAIGFGLGYGAGYLARPSYGYRCLENGYPWVLPQPLILDSACGYSGYVIP